MTYQITTYDALHANLSAANTTVMLCRANIGRIEMSVEERADLIWRIERQRAELEEMVLELGGGSDRWQVATSPTASNVVGFRRPANSTLS